MTEKINYENEPSYYSSLKEIKSRVKKDTIQITNRCNNAILSSLKHLKKLGYNKVVIQDQGGWMTYPQFAKKLKYDLEYIKTDSGIVTVGDLEKIFYSIGTKEKTILLLNSAPSYSFFLDMKAISKFATENKVLLINDVSGSIGRDIATYGDIILGSFGAAKPVNLGVGGFFAVSSVRLNFEMPAITKQIHFDLLHQRLKATQERRKILEDRASQIKKELQKLNDSKVDEHNFKIIHPEYNGINVIVKYDTEEEEYDIMRYCDTEKLEYTKCPRYIRVNEKAISIEVKRL